MTQWKVGDKAEVIDLGIGLKPSVEVGDVATVIQLDEGDGTPIFDVDEHTDFGWGNPEKYFRPISTPTYETIQINGKLYNLVPVEA